jgi:hypothetical protein
MHGSLPKIDSRKDENRIGQLVFIRERILRGQYDTLMTRQRIVQRRVAKLQHAG